ncbi:MAG TPA: hypothetical protein VE223_08170 [Nitrososphaeraceae archaeon]|nr:hypothetical protein [Nitrososphaeraceae archaeon]
MKNVNIKQQFKNVISFFAIVGLLSMTSIVVLPIGKSHAITSSLPAVPSSINTTTSLGIAASPFYESNVSKLIGQRVVSTANGITPQIETTYVKNGTIKGVGNVRDLHTWTNTAPVPPATSRFPGMNHDVGQGVITTADGQDMATWIGYGIGRSNINGTITYHDIILFNTNSTGRLAFLKNLEGLSIASENGNKIIQKIYEWK